MLSAWSVGHIFFSNYTNFGIVWTSLCIVRFRCNHRHKNSLFLLLFLALRHTHWQKRQWDCPRWRSWGQWRWWQWHRCQLWRQLNLVRFHHFLTIKLSYYHYVITDYQSTIFYQALRTLFHLQFHDTLRQLDRTRPCLPPLLRQWQNWNQRCRGLIAMWHFWASSLFLQFFASFSAFITWDDSFLSISVVAKARTFYFHTKLWAVCNFFVYNLFIIHFHECTRQINHIYPKLISRFNPLIFSVLTSSSSKVYRMKFMSIFACGKTAWKCSISICNK